MLAFKQRSSHSNSMRNSLVVIICLMTVLPSFGQARRYTRRIAPLVRPPAQSQPAQAGQRPTQAPPPQQQAPAPAPQQVYRPPVVAPAAVAATHVDPAKVQAQKSKSERDLIAWQKKRAEDGSDNAQYELGVRYLKGDGVEQDAKAGREWIEKSAKAGNAKAIKKLEELKAAEPAEAAAAAQPLAK